MIFLFLLLALGLFACFPAESRADSCQTADCHAAISNFIHQHQPLADGECLFCHTQVTTEHPVLSGKNFELVEQGALLCYQCHDEVGNKSVVHDPVREGDCLACHNPHGAANRFLLKVGEDQSELCFECHDDDPFRKDYMHGPAAAGGCTVCHNPHASSEKTLLKKSARTVCLECHVDFAVQLQVAPVVHDPVKNDPCTSCHDPHSSNAAFVLKRKMPDICFDCHTKVGDKFSKVKVRHAPLQDVASCGNCHSTHFSDARDLLLADEKTLCLVCHGSNTLGSPPLKNIKAELTKKPVSRNEESIPRFLHGPLNDGKCSGCHDPHGSDNFRILNRSYPSDIYLPYKEGSYDFCLQCHNQYMLRYKKTTLHTDFRNGNSNLHYSHVNNTRKGRTCRVCHEPHISKLQKMIKEQGVQFGEWKIPIRFKISESGGSCSPGCHRPLAYDRVTPIDNSNKP